MFTKIVSCICVTLFIISSIFLTSCARRDMDVTNAVAGKWEHGGHVFEYRDDGKVVYDGEVMKYEIVDKDTLHVIRNDKSDRDYYFDYMFNNDGTLTINKVKYLPVR